MAIVIPPNSLAKHVPHTTVLQLLDRQVNTSLPVQCHCPICGQGIMTVYYDHICQSWYNCQQCHFSGDGIQLYQAAKKLPNLRDAVFSLHNSGVVFENTELSPSTIGQYEDSIVNGRNRLLKVWESWKEEMGMYALDPAYHELLGIYKLYSGWQPSTWKVRLGQHIGMTKRAQYMDLIGGGYPKWANAISSPSYDMQGRICGFRFWTKTGSFTETIRGNYIDDGLMFLNSVTDPFEKTVYAFSDPLAAALLHARHFEDNNIPLPVVSWSENTSFSWRALQSCGKIILYSPELTPTLFKHAMRMPNSRIARRVGVQGAQFPAWLTPQTTFDFFRKTPITAYTFLSNLNEHSHEWPVVMKDWLLGNPEAVPFHLAALQMESQDHMKLLEACTRAEKDLLEGYLRGGPIIRSNEVATDKKNNEVIIERDSCYWIRTSKNERRISNFILRLEQAIRFKRIGKTFYAGQLLIQNQAINFTDMTEDQTHCLLYDWVLKKALDAGLPYPFLENRSKRRLMEISLRQHMPTTVHGLDYIGLDTGGAVDLPYFRIQGGKVLPQSVGLLLEQDMPLFTVNQSQLSEESLGYISEPSDGLSLMLTLVSAIAVNMTAKYRKEVVRPIFISSNEPTKIISVLKNLFGLKEIAYGDIGSYVHGVPALVQLNDDDAIALCKRLRSGEDTNTIILTTELSAQSAALFDQVVHIKAPTLTYSAAEMEVVLPALPQLLCLLQRKGYQLEECSTTFEAMSKELVSCLSGLLEKDCSFLLASIASTSVCRSYSDPLSFTTALVTLFKEAINNKIVEPLDWHAGSDIVEIKYHGLKHIMERINGIMPPFSVILNQVAKAGVLRGTSPRMLYFARDFWDSVTLK